MVGVAPGSRYPSGALVEGRHRARPRRPSRPAVVGASVAVAVALAGGALLLLRSGGGPLGRLLPQAPEDQVPAFAFSLGKVTPIPATAADPRDLRDEAKAAARAAALVLNRLYVEAFLDPASWRAGAYDKVWEAFEAGAADAAREDVEVLTLGTTLGASLDRVEPEGGRVTAKVLLDGEGRPVTVVAIVTFRAVAVAGDGGETLLVSRGQYFLRRLDGDWRVFSYEVERSDRQREPVVAPSQTPAGGAS